MSPAGSSRRTDSTTPQLSHDDLPRARLSPSGATGGTAGASDAGWAARETVGSPGSPIQLISGVLAAATVAKTIETTKHAKATGNRERIAPTLPVGVPLAVARSGRIGVMCGLQGWKKR